MTAPGAVEAAQWILRRRLTDGAPSPADFELRCGELPQPGPGQVLVETTYISLDPHLVAQMSETANGVSEEIQAATLPLMEVGAPVEGYALGVVSESMDPTVAVGDHLIGYWGWQTHVAVRVAGKAGQVGDSDVQVQGQEKVAFRVDPSIHPASHALHVLGEMGLTAYVGLREVGEPKPGETVFVSSAAGTVGGIAAQVAKNLGCRVVGSVGSPEKAAYVKEELGLDAAVVYRAADVEAQLDAACPEGIDVYFDNVGGSFSDLIVQRLRSLARVVLCGTTAEWNAGTQTFGPHIYWPLQIRRARVQGFILWDYTESYDDGYRQLQEWVAEGKLQCREHVVDGFESTPQAYANFLAGKFRGKALVRCSATG